LGRQILEHLRVRAQREPQVFGDAAEHGVVRTPGCVPTEREGRPLDAQDRLAELNGREQRAERREFESRLAEGLAGGRAVARTLGVGLNELTRAPTPEELHRLETEDLTRLVSNGLLIVLNTVFSRSSRLARTLISRPSQNSFGPPKDSAGEPFKVTSAGELTWASGVQARRHDSARTSV
jgi:hypothetical protein